MKISDLLSVSQAADFTIIGLDPDIWVNQMLDNFSKQAATLRTGESIRKLNSLPSEIKTSIQATIDSEFANLP